MHDWAAAKPPPTGLYTASKRSGALARKTVKRASLAWSRGSALSEKTLAAAALTNPATRGELPASQRGCTWDARRLLLIAAAVPGGCRGSWTIRARGPSKAAANSGTFVAEATLAEMTRKVVAVWPGGPGFAANPRAAPSLPAGNRRRCHLNLHTLATAQAWHGLSQTRARFLQP